MTNFEKYKEEIKEAFKKNGECGIRQLIDRTDYRHTCASMTCYECKKGIIEWLISEHKKPAVDWSKVKVDTPILVRNNNRDSWQKRHFARYEGGKVFCFFGGVTSRSNIGDGLVLPCDCAKLAEEGEE